MDYFPVARNRSKKVSLNNYKLIWFTFFWLTLAFSFRYPLEVQKKASKFGGNRISQSKVMKFLCWYQFLLVGINFYLSASIFTRGTGELELQRHPFCSYLACVCMIARFFFSFFLLRFFDFSFCSCFILLLHI